MGNDQGSLRDQFAQEATALKQIIYEFIDGDHAIMAAQLLEQYALLSPDDPDLDEIRNALYPQGIEVQKDTIPEDYKILGDIETVFILSGIITKRTGYIDSVLRKIMLMEEKWNYSPILLTCIHNIENRKAQMWLQTAGAGQVTLSAETRLINVYDYFQNSYADGLENKAVYEPANDGKQYVEVSDGVFDVYDGDTLVRKDYFTGYMGSLRKQTYFLDGNKEKDVIYDDWGYLNNECEYSPLSEDIFDKRYYTTDGDLCIEALLRPGAEGLTLEKLFFYDENGAVIECDDSAELAALCLDRMMADDKFYMLVVEDGLMSKAATEISKDFKRNAKCGVVHSIFLNDAYDPTSEPQKYYKYLCENHKDFDGIIMLTEDAKKDFQDLYGDSDNVFVVPHPYPYEINKVDFNSRDSKKAVVIARFDTFKQIHLAVDIFSLVVREIPDARLEIYGKGNEEANIKQRIAQLGLENNVFIKGYTDNPLSIFKTAALSMMTSSAEGFGLTVMESICNGCPAFAFDIKYGPSDIIDDGKTGFLIPRFEIIKYARKIIEYLRDCNMQKTMSENCYTAAPDFGTDKFLETWYSVVQTLYHKRANKDGRPYGQPKTNSMDIIK